MGTLPHYMGNGLFFPSVSHSMEKCSKTHSVKEMWDTDTHIFPEIWLLFSHSHSGILHHMRNAYVFPSISHSMEKCSRSCPKERTWDIDTHTSPKLRSLCSIKFPSYGLHMGFFKNLP